MALLAGEIMDGAAALLSDPAKVTFGYTLQLPYIKLAWGELQEELVANGVRDVEEVTSTPITVATPAKTLTSPADLLFPLKLWERAPGGSDEDWELMEEKVPDPADPMESELGIWYWEESTIKFRGATVNREVLLRYQKELATIAGDATALPVTNAKSFLSHRTAALIAESRGNKDRGAKLHGRADYFLAKLTATKVKDMQDEPYRPKRYGFSRRRRR